MILTNVKFYAETLGMHCSMNVLLPRLSLAETRTDPKPTYRTLYLLHGYSDDHSAWQRWTSIERYAEKYQLAVVMPAVHLSFYTDMAYGGKYWQFISEEIPAVARDLFPLSSLRQDNFVAGLSMGGYGAFKLALTHPERFAAAASLSGALNLWEILQEREIAGQEEWLKSMRNIFGDLKQVRGSQNDLFALAEKTAKVGNSPRLFQCCGTEDFLYANNLSFRDFARQLPLEITYEEGPGAHEWGYWDRMIQRVLEWLELC